MCLLASWNFSLVRTINVSCILLSGMCCIFVKYPLQIFAYMERNISLKSNSMSWQIFSNRVVMHCRTYWLVFFDKKLGHKLVFGISIYHIFSCDFFHCLNLLKCFERFSLELEFFYIFSQSYHCQFIILLWFGNCILYLQTDFVKVLCPWSWAYCICNSLFDSMHLLMYFQILFGK